MTLREKAHLIFDTVVFDQVLKDKMPFFKRKAQRDVKSTE